MTTPGAPSESMTFLHGGRVIKVTGYPTLAEAGARFFEGAARLSLATQLKWTAPVRQPEGVGMGVGGA